MMWDDEAIILCTRKLGEKDSIVTLFAQKEGVYNGVVKGGQGKRYSAILQPGNIVHACWKARLSEHLGSLSVELLESSLPFIIHDKMRLQALLSCTSLVLTSFAEREKDTDFYLKLRNLVKSLKNSEQNFMAEYVFFEIELLKHTGFGLELTICAATGQSADLLYVSPKTGRAVSKVAAQGYENKLLKLPSFLVKKTMPENSAELVCALTLTQYFLNKNIFHPHSRHLPTARIRLVGGVKY